MPALLQNRRQVFLLIISALVPMLLISVPALISYRAEHELRGSVVAVGRTLNVQQLIQRLTIAVLDAESGERGFLLTGSINDRARFETRAGEIPELITSLAKKTSDNKEQVQHTDTLNALIHQRIAAMAFAATARDKAGPNASSRDVATGGDAMEMAPILEVLQSMAAEERRRLEVRQEALARRARYASVVVWTLVALAATFAILALFLIQRMARARSLAKVCAWSNKIELEGQWVTFEQYLSRKFNIDTTHGISPAEAEKVRIEEGL